MQATALGGVFRVGFIALVVGRFLSACRAPSKLTPERLASLGVGEGAMYWHAQQKLAQEGYSCYVSGASRENFDCTKNAGFFPSCVLRIQFKVNDQNLVSNLRVADPACIGTP